MNLYVNIINIGVYYYFNRLNPYSNLLKLYNLSQTRLLKLTSYVKNE